MRTLEASKLCQKCTTRNDAEAMFCAGCQAHLGVTAPTYATHAARCERCNAYKVPGANWCAGCGHKIDPEAVCPMCRAAVPASARHCPFCRTDFDGLLQGLPHCWRCGGWIRDAPLGAAIHKYFLSAALVCVMGGLVTFVDGATYFLCFLVPVGIWAVLHWLGREEQAPLQGCRSCGLLVSPDLRRPRFSPRKLGPALALVYVFFSYYVYAMTVG